MSFVHLHPAEKILDHRPLAEVKWLFFKKVLISLNLRDNLFEKVLLNPCTFDGPLSVEENIDILSLKLRSQYDLIYLDVAFGSFLQNLTINHKLMLF